MLSRMTYPRCIFHKIRSTATLVDPFRIDAMLDGHFGLRHQLIELRIICKIKNSNDRKTSVNISTNYNGLKNIIKKIAFTFVLKLCEELKVAIVKVIIIIRMVEYRINVGHILLLFSRILSLCFFQFV